MKEHYKEEYFKSNNYTDYLQREERYFRMVSEIDHSLSKIGLINKDSKILDYGCAVGFLLSGLRSFGYKNCVGYDLSEWASEQARLRGHTLLDSVRNEEFDLCFSLDVFEHMKDGCIRDLLSGSSIDKLIVRIPCSEEQEPDKFFLKISRRDATHINCKTKKSWVNFFRDWGYTKFFRLNMNTIYDSEGCFCCLMMK